MKAPPWTLCWLPLRCFCSDPEGAADQAVVVHAVVERPVMGLEIVAGPGSPAGEFALGFQVQIGAVEECGFGQVVHAIWAFL
jgi:hypothetical protein